MSFISSNSFKKPANLHCPYVLLPREKSVRETGKDADLTVNNG